MKRYTRKAKKNENNESIDEPDAKLNRSSPSAKRRLDRSSFKATRHDKNSLKTTQGLDRSSLKTKRRLNKTSSQTTQVLDQNPLETTQDLDRSSLKTKRRLNKTSSNVTQALDKSSLRATRHLDKSSFKKGRENSQTRRLEKNDFSQKRKNQNSHFSGLAFVLCSIGLAVVFTASYYLFFNDKKKTFSIKRNAQSNEVVDNTTDNSDQNIISEEQNKPQEDITYNYDNLTKHQIEDDQIDIHASVYNPKLGQSNENKNENESKNNENKELLELAEIDDSKNTENQSVKDSRKVYEDKMIASGYTKFSERWVHPNIISFEQNNEEKWRNGDALIQNIWYPKEELGFWNVIITNEGKTEGFLLEKNNIYVYRNLTGESKNIFVNQVSYKKQTDSPIEIYFKQLDLIKSNPREHYSLGVWCEKQNLLTFAKHQFERTIFVDPNHSEARRKLGFFNFKDEWLSLEEVKQHPNFVFLENRWITKEQASSLGYIEKDKKWFSPRDYQAHLNDKKQKQMEEERESKAFNDKLFFGDSKNQGKDIWEVTYDFSNGKYLETLVRALKQINNGANIVVENGILDIASPNDFSVIYFPPVFSGDVHLEFKARLHAASTRDLLVRIFNDEGRFGFGSNGYLFGLSTFLEVNNPNIIALLDGEKTRVLTRRTKPKIQPGQWYNIVAQVRGSSLNFYVDNEQVMNKRNTRFRNGLVGFGTYQSRIQISQIKMIGRVDEKWFKKSQKALEASLRLEAEARSEFYREKEISPIILKRLDMMEAMKSAVAKQNYLSSIENFNNQKFDEALKLLDQVQRLEPQFLLTYISRGKIYLYLEDSQKAFTNLNKAIQLAPNYAESYVVRGLVKQDQENYEDAIKDFEKARELEQGYTEPYRYLASLYIEQGKKDKVKEVMQDVQKNAPKDPDTRKLVKGIEISLNGPQWLKKYEKVTDHYHVMTDVSQKYCNEMSLRLELLYKEYSKIFAESNLPKRVSRVLIFESRSEFSEYSYLATGDFMENAAGYYSPTTKELVLFDDFSKEETIDTLYHEGFHQFLHLFVKKIPLWFNEGMATYMGASQLIRGKLHTGHIHPYRLLELQYLLKTDYTKLDKLIQYSATQFRDPQKQGSHYTLSWSLIQFFIHGNGGKYRSLIGKYLLAIKEGKNEEQAYNAVFAGVNFDRLDKEWVDYFTKMEAE